MGDGDVESSDSSPSMYLLEVYFLHPVNVSHSKLNE